MTVRALTLLLLASCASAAPQEKDPADLTDQFLVPEGLEVRLWAESPLFFNPTNIDIDRRGRIWVAEAVNYRGKQNQPDRLQHPKGDRIMILEDTDGDGTSDSSKVFVQDRDLVAPLGIAVLGKYVVVSCSPSAILYTDEDGDDKPDKKELLLTGFGGRDHDHGLHSFVVGPDGSWYFNVGNAGPHEVKDKAGWTLRSSCAYMKGKGGLKSDDGRVWTGGLTLRLDRDGTGLKVMGHNYRNSYEVAVDAFGNLWQNDNDDEVQSCRTSWIMEGGSFGFYSPDGARTWRADRRPGQSIQTAHWRQEDPGVLPSGDVTGAGGPTGSVVYEGHLLPKRFNGMLLDADAGRNTVFGHVCHPEGAGFRLERTLFLSTRRESTAGYVWNKVQQDKTTWFRPSDVAVGPDGAVYVADWYDPIVGGHDMREGQGYGRILRIAPKGSHPRPGRVGLENPAINVRALAPVNLVELDMAWRSPDPRLRARAVWYMELDQLKVALRDRDPRIRVTAFRALRRRQKDVLKTAERLARDPSPAVRREVAIALRDIPLPRCREIILTLAEGYDGKDRFYLEALGQACDGKEASIFPDLLRKLGNEDPLHWSPAFERLVWRLHPPAAVEALATRARAGRRLCVDALAFVRHPDAAKAMKQLAKEGPDGIREAAEWWFKNRVRNTWKGFPVDDPASVAAASGDLSKLKATLLDEKAPAADQASAGEQLAATKDGGLFLLGLASQGKMSDALKAVVSEVIFRNPDITVRALAGEYFKRPAKGGKPFPPVKELLKMKGDAERGKKVFFNEKVGCSRCHTFGDKGREVGPILTEIANKLDAAGVLDAILNPSAGISFGYEPIIIMTKDRKVVTGILLADGDEVMLRDSSGEDQFISADEILHRKQSKTSLMPDNISSGMTPQDLVDVVKFLLTPPK